MISLGRQEPFGCTPRSIAPIPATISLKESESFDWDVVILGAGVAGASAAILASKQGLKTLLVESKTFPREKVCGGCLNLRSQASLERLGVSKKIEATGAVRIESMRLQILTTQAQWDVPTMVSVRRSTLDCILVEQAVSHGAHFLDRTVGTLMPTGPQMAHSLRSIQLQRDGETSIFSAKSVLVASGLGRSSIRQSDHWPAKVESNSRIGVQCFASESQSSPFSDGRLHMIVGNHGYVGICKTDGGVLDVAAAIDPASIRSMGGIRQVVQTILADCGLDGIELPERDQWLATPSLTRSSSRVTGHRTFLIGDAIGYIEPFTGEGMSWAMASAETVLPIISKIAVSGWQEEMGVQWNDWVHRQRSYKHQTCRWIAGQIRWPRRAAWVLRACDWLPPLRSAIIRKTSQ